MRVCRRAGEHRRREKKPECYNRKYLPHDRPFEARQSWAMAPQLGKRPALRMR